MRIMGLDVGDRTIGVAISDPLGLTAQGVEVIKRRRPEDDLRRLRELVGEYEVGEIVVGLPRNMDGSHGPRVFTTREFIEYVQPHLAVPVHEWDERLTTAAAQRLLIEADISRRGRKKVIDKMAAQLILQGFLEARKKDL